MKYPKELQKQIDQHLQELTHCYETTFQHVYLVSGFDCGEVEPHKRHTCLRMGYWCWKNLWEYPLDLFAYLKKKI